MIALIKIKMTLCAIHYPNYLSRVAEVLESISAVIGQEVWWAGGQSFTGLTYYS